MKPPINPKPMPHEIVWAALEREKATGEPWAEGVEKRLIIVVTS